MGLVLDSASNDFCGLPLVLLAAVAPLPPGWQEYVDAQGEWRFLDVARCSCYYPPHAGVVAASLAAALRR